MSLSETLKKSLFQHVELAFDLQSGQIGISVKNKEGEFVVTFKKLPAKEGEAKEPRFELIHNPMTDFGFTFKYFAMRTPVKDLTPGDIVLVSDDGPAFFLSVADENNINNPTLNIVNLKTGRKMELTVPTNTLLGCQGIMCVKAPSFGNSGGGDNSFNPMMMMLLMGKNKDKSDSKHMMLMMMLMQQQQNKDNNNNMNSLLPFMLMSNDEDGEGDNDSLLPFLLMNKGGMGDMSSMLPLLLSGGEMDSNKMLMMSMLSGGGNNLLPLLMCSGGDKDKKNKSCPTVKPKTPGASNF